MLQLRKTTSGLRYFLPTALIVASLLVIGIRLANTSPVSVDAVSQTATPTNQQNVPTNGQPLKFGAYIINQNNPDSIEQMLGDKLNVVGWYTHWDTPLAGQKLKETCARNDVPSITWESWNSGNPADVTTPYSLKDIAAGKFDNKIRADLQNATKVCKNQVMIIRFDHEMNSNVGSVLWYPWQGDPSNYVAAWRHVVGIGHQVSPNIKWLWSPNHTATEDLVDPYYPGGKWVDYVGVSLNRVDNAPEEPQSFASFYEKSRVKIESFNKPVIIAETAVVEGNSPTRKADWILNMFSYARHRKHIVAILYYNGETKRAGIPKNSYMFDSSQVSLDAFKQALSEYRAESGSAQ